MTSGPIEQGAGRGPTRGWCPGALEPMESGDGWLLRIRLPGGAITAASLERVAGVAATHGSGIVDITSRANLQIRGLSPHVLDRATSTIVEAGLAGADPRTDRLRAVVCSPLTGHDPHARCDALTIVDAAVATLATEIGGTVPSKFGVVIDDGGSWPLDHLDADVALHARSGDTWAVRVRGVDEPIGSTTCPVDVAVRTAHACAEQQARMDGVVAALGIDGVTRLLLDAAPAGRVPEAPRRPPEPRPTVGLLPHPEPDRVNIVAAPFLARLDADTLAAVAGYAAEHAAVLRLTPERSIALCGVWSASSASLLSRLRELNLVVNADDPRSSVSACVGALGCTSAHADTEQAATRLAATARPLARVHLSACAKTCGAPAGVRHLVADETGTFR